MTQSSTGGEDRTLRNHLIGGAVITFVLTAGIGLHPHEDLSIDLVYHRYLQDDASEQISSSVLEAEATGESRRLGDEIDLVVGYEPAEYLSISGFFGCFLPGAAFENGADEALLARIDLMKALMES